MRVDVVCAHIYKQRLCGGRVGGIHQNIYHKNYKKKTSCAVRAVQRQCWSHAGGHGWSLRDGDGGDHTGLVGRGSLDGSTAGRQEVRGGKVG